MIERTYMSIELPPCPFHPVEREVIKRHIERQELVDDAVRTLRARSFGRRVFASMQLRYSIARYRGLQRASETAYEDLVSPDAIGAYRQWQDDLALAIESR